MAEADEREELRKAAEGLARLHGGLCTNESFHPSTCIARRVAKRGWCYNCRTTHQLIADLLPALSRQRALGAAAALTAAGLDVHGELTQLENDAQYDELEDWLNKRAQAKREEAER